MCSLCLHLGASDEIERTGLSQDVRPRAGGCIRDIRDTIAKDEGVEAFHDSCGSRKRGIVAVLGLMIGRTPSTT